MLGLSPFGSRHLPAARRGDRLLLFRRRRSNLDRPPRHRHSRGLSAQCPGPGKRCGSVRLRASPFSRRYPGNAQSRCRRNLGHRQRENPHRQLPAVQLYWRPGSVQLADGSIFIFYNLVKPEVVRDGDIVDLDRQITLTPRWHSYIAGSCYTEDYIRTPE